MSVGKIAAQVAWLAAFAILLSAFHSAHAGEANDQTAIRVGIYVSEPFVMSGPHGYTGLVVDLWNAIAARLGRRTEFVPASSLPQLLQSVRAGDTDIAITNITVTADRARQVSFTQPWFDAGLRIMIHEERQIGPWDLLRDLRRLGYLASYAWLGGALLLITLVVTFVERRLDSEFPRRWGPGLAQSFYHVMAVTTSGRTTHKNLFGSIGTVFAAVWMACSVAVMAYVTSTVTSVMTSSSIVRHISGFGDLPGKRIAVEAGSIAQDYLLSLSLDTRAYSGLERAVEALMKGEVDAVVGDAANLEYFDKQHPKLPVTEVGKIFETSKYAFALPPNSSLTHEVTVQLLSLEEDQSLDRLRAHYFGATP